MSLVPSLLSAILRLDGEALVMHVGEKPYVVAPAGQVELATRPLNSDAVSGMVAQLLPPELQQALDEFGAVQYEFPHLSEFPGENFSVVAARGGDDIWVEVRRRRVPDDDLVPEELFGPSVPVAQAAPSPAIAPPSQSNVATATTGVAPAVAPPSAAIVDDDADLDLALPDADHLWPSHEPASPTSEAELPAAGVGEEQVAIDVGPEAQPIAEQVALEPQLEVTADQIALERQLERTAEQVPSEPQLDARAEQVALEPQLEVTADQIAVEPQLEATAAQVASEPQIEARAEQVDRGPRLDVIAEEVELEAQLDTTAERVDREPQFDLTAALDSEAAALQPLLSAAPLPKSLEPSVSIASAAPMVTAAERPAAAAPVPEPPVSTAWLPKSIELSLPVAPAAPIVAAAEPPAVEERWTQSHVSAATVPKSVEPAVPIAPAAPIAAAAEPPRASAPAQQPVPRIERMPAAVEPPPLDFVAASEPAAAMAERAAPAAERPAATFERVASESERLAAEPVEPVPAVIVPLARSPIRPEPAAAPPAPRTGLDRLLRIAAARGASALYLTSQARPSIRIDGEIQPLAGEAALSPTDVESLLIDLMPERNREELRSGIATEWIADVSEVGRVRCMTFRDHRGAGGIFRMMPLQAISADQLGLSREIQALAAEPEGLVLVTGPRASGKSTLVSAFVDLINRTRRDHVITIESEIKVVHEQRHSLVSQREVRGSADEMLGIARSALRENPDVLVFEELRTADLVTVALEAAGSGHLVIGALPAHTAPAAIDRMIDLYHPEQRRQVQLAIAENLRGVVAQVLARKRTGGRAAAREVLLNTPAVAGVIAEGKTSQLPAAIDGGRKYGMISLNDALAALVQNGTVDPREACRHAADRGLFLALLRREGIDTSSIERLA